MNNFSNLHRRVPRLGVLFGVLLLSGCATFSADGGFDKVNAVARERLGTDVVWQRSAEARDSAEQRVSELLRAPLTADSAVQIALLNNRGLQARFAELGIVEADVVQAGRLWNPVFAAAGWRNQEGLESLLSIESSLLGLLLTPNAVKFETMRFDYARLNAAKAVLELADETRKAYYDAVAEQQLVEYFEQVKLAADAAADLAKQMAKVGNMSKRDQAREQVFYAETVARLARTKQRALASREKLTRMLGLWGGGTAFELPETLPNLPAKLASGDNLESIAIASRLDVQLAKKETEYLAEGLGMTKATRFINVLNLGAESEKKPETRRLSGPTLKLEIPLFDFGDARIAKYQAQYQQSVDRLAEVAVNARSEVRAAYPAYRTAYETAQHYRTEIVPLRKKISDQNLLYYNGMLISIFELLADTREQISSVVEYIEALRDFWVAESELRAALGGQPLVMDIAAKPAPEAGAAADKPAVSDNAAEPAATPAPAGGAAHQH